MYAAALDNNVAICSRVVNRDTSGNASAASHRLRYKIRFDFHRTSASCNASKDGNNFYAYERAWMDGWLDGWIRTDGCADG